MRKAIDFQQRELAEHPDQWTTARSLAGNYCNLGNLLYDEQKDYPEAIKCFDEAVRLLTDVDRDHPTDLSATFLANSLQGRACTWIKMGEKEKFNEDLDRAIAITDDHVNPTAVATGQSLLPGRGWRSGRGPGDR